MDELISRQAAIAYSISGMTREIDGDKWIRVSEVRESIKTMPSVQPEIIRCGECRWFQCNMRMDGYLPKGVVEFECRHWCGSCDPVDFCSHAERKTDE